MVSLPYEKDFNEKQIPTKARPIQMNQELLEYCKKEIQDLLTRHGVVQLFMSKRLLKLKGALQG